MEGMVKWLTDARQMLSDEKNIVADAGNYFEPRVATHRLVGDTIADVRWEEVARVCGAGAFYYARRDTDALVFEKAFAFKGQPPGKMVGEMTSLIGRHRYGELLDLYDEAIAHWTAVETGVIPVAA